MYLFLIRRGWLSTGMIDSVIVNCKKHNIPLYNLPNEIRSKIISKNLQELNSYIWVPESCKSLKIPKKGLWKLFKETCALTYEKKGWFRVALSITAIACTLGICFGGVAGFFYLSRISVMQNIEDIGKRFDITSVVDGISFTRYNALYTKMDCIFDCAFLALGNVALSFLLTGAFTFGLYKYNLTVRNFVNLTLENRDTISRHKVILKKQKCSISNVDLENLVNNKENKKFIDPITFDEITEEQLFSPNTLLIGSYAIPVKTALNAIISRCNGSFLGIPHPIEQRCLSKKEEEVLIKDLSLLLCTNEKKIRAFWEFDDIDYRFLVETVAEKDYPQWDKASLDKKVQYRHLLRKKLKEVYYRNKLKDIIPKDIMEEFFHEINHCSYELPVWD